MAPSARHRNTLTVDLESEDLRVALRELRRTDRDMPDENLKSVREVARGVRDLARVRALEEPTSGKGHTGLRRNVSRGVKLVNITGGIRVITETPEQDQAIIPRGMDNARGWRHPVFGNMNNWVTQTSGSESWFIDSMRTGEEPLRNRLINNVNDAAERIARGGS